jgi:hypothetical protein
MHWHCMANRTGSALAMGGSSVVIQRDLFGHITGNISKAAG